MGELVRPGIVVLSKDAPTYRSTPVALDALTASLTLTLQRPTTLAPLNWDEKSTVRVSLVFLVDGTAYRCDGQASGGIRVRADGAEAGAYSLSYKPPVILGDKAREYIKTATKDAQDFYNDVPLTRIGELGASLQGYVELELLQGTVETAITLATTTDAPAPTIRTKNSVAYDAATDGQELNGDGVLSVSHTASGSDRAVFAGVSGSTEPTAVTSITYAGAGMTQLWDFRDSGPSILNGGFILAGVGTGAQTVTSTLDASTSDHALGVISFTGVDQTAPTGNTRTATGTSTSASVTVTGVVTGDMVVDNVVTAYGSGTAPAVGANQTERYTETMAWVGSHVAGSTQAGADGGVMSWTFDSRRYTLGAARLIAAASGTTVTPGIVALTLASFAPSVIVNKIHTPGIATLTLTGFAPSVVVNTTVTPSIATLSLTGFAPTVTATANLTVTPSTATLALTGFAPTVTATGGVSVTPSIATLALTGFAPTVSIPGDTVCAPDAANLTLTTFAPTVEVSIDDVPVVIIGGDDAPKSRRKRRKDTHDTFREMEATIHGLLHPEPEAASEVGVEPVAAGAARRAIDELVVLAQGQHALLQRAAALRAELREYETARQAAIEQDEEDAMIWLF